MSISSRRRITFTKFYKTSGYESLETLRLLDGVIDIYLPDIKYADDTMAEIYSSGRNYVESNRAALREMWRQVGPLVVDDEGVARRGLIVRHLVLPDNVAGSIESLKWLAEKVGARLHLSVMSQYFPAHQAFQTPPVERQVSSEEYQKVLDFLDTTEFEGWIQPLE